MEQQRKQQPVTQDQFEKLQEKIENKYELSIMVDEKVKALRDDLKAQRELSEQRFKNNLQSIKIWIFSGIGAGIIIPFVLHYVFLYLDQFIK